MAKTDFSSLIGKAKQTQITTPVQRFIEPISKKKKEKIEETIFSLYIPTNRLKALKIMSAQQEISLKDLINEAIEEKYFK